MEAESESLRIEGDRLSDPYRWYADDAVRLAYLLTGDRALAEDLVQDAYVRLAGRLVHLRGSSQAFQPDQSVWTSVDGASWTRVPTEAFQGAAASDSTAWRSRLVVVGTTDDGHNAVWISPPQPREGRRG